MNTICQRCSHQDLSWKIRRAEVNVGGLDHWKIQLCLTCTARLEEAIRTALLVN
jgi:hypothetical protein